MRRQRYVVGLAMYDHKVLLIRKCRPLWQAGGLNGVGGKVKKYEDYYSAMIRECNEEAGLVITNWQYLGLLTDNTDYIVKFYKADVPNLEMARTLTDETVSIFDLSTLNYGWLIPPTDVFLRLSLNNVFEPIELIME